MTEKIIGPHRKVRCPSDYKPEYCQMLIDHMAEGFTYTSFPARLPKGCVATLYNWEKEHPEFLEAKNRGKVLLQFWDEGNLNEMITGENSKGNTAAAIFKMKNCHNWTDRHEHDLSEETIKVMVKAQEK